MRYNTIQSTVSTAARLFLDLTVKYCVCDDHEFCTFGTVSTAVLIQAEATLLPPQGPFLPTATTEHFNIVGGENKLAEDIQRHDWSAQGDRRVKRTTGHHPGRTIEISRAQNNRVGKLR